MIQGEFSRARRKTSRTIRGPWQCQLVLLGVNWKAYFSEVFLHKFRSDNSDEGGFRGIGNGLDQHCLSGSWGSAQITSHKQGYKVTYLEDRKAKHLEEDQYQSSYIDPSTSSALDDIVSRIAD